MSKVEVQLDDVTSLKLKIAAARLGMTPEEAARQIAVKGPRFFYDKLVGATKRDRVQVAR